MNVAALVPFASSCRYRDRAWSWVRSRYEQAGLDVIVGKTDTPGFSRTQAILNARAQSDADVFIVADADVWCDDLDDLITAASNGWSVPGKLHRLSDPSTWRLLAGEPWRGLPLSTDNPQDHKPYDIHPGGTLLALSAAAFDSAPPDPRFIGWGHEDSAWAHALKRLIGKPGTAAVDVVHLWHPPEPRQSRYVGSADNRKLGQRYRNAKRHPKLMQQLIEEGRRWASATSVATPQASPRS